MKKQGVIFLSGGLGNQMFQYSFYKYLIESGYKIDCDFSLLNDRSIHNGFELEKIFENITVTNSVYSAYVVRLLYHIIFLKKISLLHKLFNALKINLVVEEDLANIKKGHFNFILGYWQNSKYLPRNFEFNFKNKLLSITTENLSRIIRCQNSISIHIRRGDYLKPENAYLFGNICTEQYYEDAINIILAKVENPIFYCFSNDIEWVKENLKIPNVTYVEFNKGADSWQDLYLMSCCKHNITANSTFSWWGAWLNKNPQKIVISPRRLTNNDKTDDIFPKEWIRL